jgi:6-phosphogluconolactonase
MEILIERDLEAISAKAARFFMTLAEKRIRESGSFVIALSGGSTPIRFYKSLASALYRRTIAWSKVHIFWVDERYVASDHPDSNFRLIHDNLLQDIMLPRANMHPINTDCSSPSACAKNYEAEIREFFNIGEKGMIPRFDLVMLGIGEDGHIASLFPGSRALSDRKRLAVAVRSRTRQHNRITLTIPVLNNAAHIVFLCSGEAKAPILEKVVIKRKKNLPASLVCPDHGKCLFLIDRDAGRYMLNAEVNNHAER